MFRQFILSLVCLASISAPLLPLAVAHEHETAVEEKTVYRIFYRVGSKSNFQEATEAGSPFESKELAIEAGKRVQEKFDRGGLAAFEIEIRQNKVVTRAATEEEQQAYADADLVAPTPAGSSSGFSGPANVTQPAASAVPHAAQTTTGLTQSAESNRSRPTSQPGDHAPYNAPADVPTFAVPTPPAEVVVPLGPTVETTQPSTVQTPAAESPAGQGSSEGTLVLDENVPKRSVESTTQIKINIRDERTAAADSQAPTVAGSNADPLDALVARLKSEEQASNISTGVDTAAVNGVAIGSAASNLNPGFFDSGNVVPSRPQVARRIRVVRGGQEVARIEYDAQGGRIEPSESADTQVSESSQRPEADAGAGRPEGELTFNENAPRNGSPADAAEQNPDATPLVKEREALQLKNSQLQQREGELDGETDRLNAGRSELDREKESLKSRTKELDVREKNIADSVIAGRTADGALAGGKVKLKMSFQQGGRLTANDGFSSFDGKWTLDGDRVTIEAGDSTLSGTLNGNTVSGSRTITNGERDNWSVTLKGLAPVLTLRRHEMAQSRSRLAEDQKSHDQKQLKSEEQFDRLQTQRRTLKAEKSLYEDDFARHRQKTVEFNNGHNQ